jgi:hypothetical protein
MERHSRRALSAVAVVVVVACGRTSTFIPDCMVGDARACDAKGRVGSQVCEPSGAWGMCLAGGDDDLPSAAAGNGGQPSGGQPGVAGVLSSAGTLAMGGMGADGGWGGEPPVCEPSVEDCVTTADEDCNGLTPPCSGATQFGRSYGALAEEFLFDLAAKPDGSFAISVNGAFYGVDFGSPEGTLPNAGDWDAYVVSFDSDAQALWARGFGDDASQQFHGIAFDAQGALLATGIFEGSYVLDGESFGPPNVNVLAKFDTQGNVVWAKAFAGSEGSDVAPFSNGDVVMVGHVFGGADFGGGTLTGPSTVDGYVVKFTEAGDWLWDYPFSGSTVLPEGVAVDAAGDVVVIGRFADDFDFGQGPVGGTGSWNGFIVRFDSEGELVRGQTFGQTVTGPDDNGWAFPEGVAVDDQRNVVISGNFDGNIDFGDGSHTASEGMFVVKFDVSGNVLWSRDYDSGQVPTGATDVAVDPFGNVLMAGYFRNSLDTPMPLSGAADAVVIKLDPDGDFIWARAFGADYAEAMTIASDALGNALVGGRFFEDIDFGEGVVSAQNADIFVVKLEP